MLDRTELLKDERMSGKYDGLKERVNESAAT
jgi:hypothetical protein